MEDRARERPDRTRELARAGRHGDRRAFAALYERMAPALYAWASVKVRRHPALQLEPEDVVQEVWCRALDVLVRFDPEKTSFRAWIFRVAKNVLHEAMRRSLPGQGVLTCEGRTSRAERLAACPEEVTSLTGRVARDEGVQRFLARVRAMSEEDCRLVLHCGLEELSCPKAAARMGLTPDAVAKRWQRLRERLRSEGFERYLTPSPEP